MTMQKEEERQNRVLMEIIDNAKVESQNLLLILARGMVFTRNCMMRQNAADQPRMPPDEHSA